MQRRVFNCATARVANTDSISGWATADEINRGLRTEKGSKLWRIACSTCLGPLMMAGLFVAVEPLPVRADRDEDSRPGHEDNEKGIRAEITALQAQVAALQTANTSLQNAFNSLQASNAKLQNQVSSLQTSNTTLQNQLANAKNVLVLDPFCQRQSQPRDWRHRTDYHL
jgi:septal ring factor EnvC (AmiA/AmiB activator)